MLPHSNHTTHNSTRHATYSDFFVKALKLSRIHKSNTHTHNYASIQSPTDSLTSFSLNLCVCGMTRSLCGVASSFCRITSRSHFLSQSHIQTQYNVTRTTRWDFETHERFLVDFRVTNSFALTYRGSPHVSSRIVAVTSALQFNVTYTTTSRSTKSPFILESRTLSLSLSLYVRLQKPFCTAIKVEQILVDLSR